MAPPRRRSFRKIRSKKNKSRSNRRTIKSKAKIINPYKRGSIHRLLVNIL